MTTHMTFDLIIQKSKHDIKYIKYKNSLHRVNPKLVFKLKEELEKEFNREDYKDIYTIKEKTY